MRVQRRGCKKEDEEGEDEVDQHSEHGVLKRKKEECQQKRVRHKPRSP